MIEDIPTFLTSFLTCLWYLCLIVLVIEYKIVFLQAVSDKQFFEA